MSQIKKFVDKVANCEARQIRELLIPVNDAKELRDEILKLLIEKNEVKSNSNEVVEVVVNGGKW